MLIGSIKSRLPKDMNKVMLNNNNKASLMKLLFKFIIDGKQRSLCSLDTGKIISTGHDECITVTYDSTEENLKSNQEEADTKVILHAMNAIRSGGDVVIRSPSGDTDIKAYLDYSNGKCRKQMYLGAVGIKDEEKTGACRFYSFTWNDYIAAIFTKGKKHCWSTVKSNGSFLRAFTKLGTDWDLTEQQVNAIEKYMCALYKSKKKSVNDVRYDLFEKKQNKEGKIIDLSLIPPCFSSLYFTKITG